MRFFNILRISKGLYPLEALMKSVPNVLYYMFRLNNLCFDSLKSY